MISINLQAMLKNREVPAYVKDAIRCILDRGAFTVGSYLKEVSTSDIRAALTSCDYLFESMQASKDGVNKFKTEGKIEGIVTLLDVLTTGEALEIPSSSFVLKDRFNALKILLGVEQISRQKPGIEVMYKNLTLDVDKNSDVLVAKCNGKDLKYSMLLDRLKVKREASFLEELENIVSEEKSSEVAKPSEPGKGDRASKFDLSSLKRKKFL